MKKTEKYLLLLFFFLICQFHNSYSQKTSFFGVYASPQKTFLHGNSDFVSEPTYNMSGGLLYGFSVMQSAKLILYAGYHQQGQDFYKLHNDGFLKTHLSVDLNYAKSGAIIEYEFLSFRNSYLSIFAGPEISFLLTSKDNFTDNYYEEINLPKTQYHKTDFDLMLGIGYTKTIFENLSVSLKLRTEQAYINVFKKDEDTSIPYQNEFVGFVKARNSTVGFMIELKYSLIKKTEE